MDCEERHPTSNASSQVDSSRSSSSSMDVERGTEEAVPLLKMSTPPSSQSGRSSRSSSLSTHEKYPSDILPFFLKSENANRSTSPPPMFFSYAQIPHPLASIPRRYYRFCIIFGVFLLAFIALVYTTGGGLEDQVLADPTPTAIVPEGEQNRTPEPPPEVDPPLYPEYFAYEDTLLQHHTALHSGTQRKYIYWANHVHLLGFNNHLEEYLLNAHLAYVTDRSFVAYEYTWNPNFETEPYSEWFGRKIPSRVPESVSLGGWLAGVVRQDLTVEREASAWDTTPVSRPYFEEACPLEERVYLNVGEVMDTMMDQVLDITRYPELAGKRIRDYSDGMQLLQAWKARLEKDDVRDARCLELRKDSGHAFDFWLFGSSTLHALWPSLAESPVLRHWSFSPLIYEAFRRNTADLGLLGPSAKSIVGLEGWMPSAHDEQKLASFSASVVDGIEYDEYGYPAYPGERPKLPIYASPPSVGDGSVVSDNLKNGRGNVTFEEGRVKVLPYPRTPQPRPDDESGDGMLPILAMHLRRGDFEEHCRNLAEWGSSFMGFVSFDEFAVRDGFRPPQIVKPAKSTEERGDSGFEKGQDNPEQDDLRRRELDEDAVGAAEALAAHGTIKIRVPSAGEVTSQTGFTGHAFDDPSTVDSEEQRFTLVARHCYPDNRQIVKRVRDVVKDWVARRWILFLERHEKDIAGKRDENEGVYEEGLARWKDETLSKLKAVYIMTNGKKEWAEAVRLALRGLDGEGDADGLSRWDFKFAVDVEVQREVLGLGAGVKTKRRTLEWTVEEWPWDVDHLAKAAQDSGEDSGMDSEGGHLSQRRNPVLITTARDLELTHEEKYAAQGVDMYIGQRAEVFIGNGFSSMTANVVMLRKNGGLDPLQSRLW